MKINHLGFNVNPYNKQSGKIERTEKTNKNDKIEISSEAIHMQKIGSIESERTEKVEKIKNQVESGQYELNARKIAEKMYSFWNEMK